MSCAASANGATWANTATARTPTGAPTPTASATATPRPRRRGTCGAAVALDCTAGAGTLPILLGVEALKRKGGTIVVQGEMKEFPNFPLERVTVKFITIKSARGHSYRACELALAQLASKRFPLERV